LNNISCKSYFLEGITTWSHKCKGRCLNHTFFTKLHKKMSFHNQKCKVLSKVSFATNHPFWKDLLHQNNYILHYQTHWTFSSFVAFPPSSSY
jgi:hypothetical protein